MEGPGVDPREEQEILSSSKYPDRFWGPPCLPAGVRVLAVKRPKHEAYRYCQGRE